MAVIAVVVFPTRLRQDNDFTAVLAVSRAMRGYAQRVALGTRRHSLRGGLWWQTRRPTNLLEDLAHPELIDPSAFDTQRFSPGSFYLKTKGKVGLMAPRFSECTVNSIA